MKFSAHLLIAQRAFAMTVLMLHSVSYIMLIGGATSVAALNDYLSSSSASYATILSTVIILTCRHDFRRLLHLSSGRKELTHQKEKDRPIRLLTYNLFCRPPLVRNNSDDYKEERLELFLKEIEKYDIVAVQEIFELLTTRQSRLIKGARKLGFKYCLRGIWPSFSEKKFVDAGLVILSKYPITRYDHHMFKNAAEIDQFSAKQVMYAGVNVHGKMVHVYTAHTQATYGNNDCGAPKSGNALFEWGQKIIKGGPRLASEVVKECDDARVAQMHEVRQFIDKTLQNGSVLGQNDIAVFMGDINVDSLNSQSEYAAVMEAMTKGNSYHVSDLFYDTKGCHPITYGDVCPKSGKSLETTLTAPMDCGTKMSLDYIFLFRGKDSDGQLIAPFKVDDVKVEPFFVDKKKMKVPITQLSDHYGMSATLSTA